ncbi:slipin family protein, partial [Streptomyces mirabilis]
LQTVVAVAAEKNSTLVLPFPVELLRFLERAQQPAAPAPEQARPSTAQPVRESVEQSVQQPVRESVEQPVEQSVQEQPSSLAPPLGSDPEGSKTRQD